jgi:hypothetical protein
MAFQSDTQLADALPPFDPTRTYTSRQLELYATKLLVEERRDIKARREAGEDVIDDGAEFLLDDALQSRHRREILPASGTPDPSVVQGIYNRTHPEGRKTNTKAQRAKNGASFYR